MNREEYKNYLLKELNITLPELVGVMFMALGFNEYTRANQLKAKRERRAATKKTKDNNE